MKYEEKYNMKLSIVTVCYNAEQCIDRTIKSVLNQTCPVYEYIILMEGQKTKRTIEFAVTRNLLQKREYYLSYFRKRQRD